MSGNQRAAAGFQSLGSIFGDLPEPKQRGLVVEAHLSELHPFKNHPFQVRDDESMQELVDSIKANGVLYPAIVRPRQEGGYEIIAGHRRHHACKRIGLSVIPIEVRDMDDDTATISMVNSNCQREKVLHSERAFAYKMLLDAQKRQGSRTDLTSTQFGLKSKREQTTDNIASKVSSSRNQIQRYIRLTELIAPLLELVDNEKIPVNAAYELSFLLSDNQQIVMNVLMEIKRAPTIKHAETIRRLQDQGRLDKETVRAVFMPTQAKPSVVKISFPSDLLSRCFPSHSQEQIVEAITEMLMGRMDQTA